MNFLGVGLVEVAVILVVAFLVLGPSGSIDVARAGGRLVRNLRDTWADLTSIVDTERDAPGPSRGASRSHPDDGATPTPRNQ